MPTLGAQPRRNFECSNRVRQLLGQPIRRFEQMHGQALRGFGPDARQPRERLNQILNRLWNRVGHQWKKDYTLIRIFRGEYGCNYIGKVL